ncbi:phosphofurin acidic cluster sorting protein 2 [Nematostella vectensis]|nr:phosphofurin acidic cluster sorting protein 2 [Nematostella vectensis]
MAEQGRSRVDGAPRETAVAVNPERPVPMKLFATWEVERTSPYCIPRTCSLKLTRLEVLKPLEANLREVIIAVSMQSSRRTLRSNEIILRQSGLIDTVLDLSFSLQYPHFIKRNGNNLQVMLQRRKKYKNRAILGFKTLAVGLVDMGQVLQFNMDNQLKLYVKGNSSHVAQVTVSSLTSQPVDTESDRVQGSTTVPNMSYVRDGESSDDDDDYSLSENSDSGADPDLIEEDQRQAGKIRQRTIASKNQRNFKQKFIALLKKFKVADDELGDQQDQFLDMDISPPEIEAADDDFMYVDDLYDDDSDMDNLPEDTISISSTPKPSLRPFFDARNSSENVLKKVVIKEEDDQLKQILSQIESDENNASTDPETHLDTLTPPSDVDSHSDSPCSDPGVPDHDPVVRRSVSFKERRHRSETAPEASNKRRNSDVEIQLPKRSLSDQLTCVLPLEDDIPESILLVNTAEWQGQLLALKLWDEEVKMICTRCSSDIQAVFAAIVNKYQKFCNTHSDAPPNLRIGIAGTEPYISSILRPYVEHLSSKPPEWQTYIRFLVIPLGTQPLAKYIASLDSTYNSMFLDSHWREAFVTSQPKVDFDLIRERVANFMSAPTFTYNLPIAEALINTKAKGMEEGSAQLFLPFVCDVKIGSMDTSQDEEVVTTIGSPSTSGVTITGTSLRGDSQAPAVSGSQSPPLTSSTPPMNPSNPIHVSPVAAPPGSSGIGSELMDLQVDYWLVPSTKKEVTKSSLKTTFKSLTVTRLPSAEEPSALSLQAITKERKQRGFEAMMRSMKKTKEKDSDTRNQPVVASVSKLICTTKGQSNTLNVMIDGFPWSGVKFFSLSSQWPTHVKQFPVGLFTRVEQ